MIEDKLNMKIYFVMVLFFMLCGCRSSSELYRCAEMVFEDAAMRNELKIWYRSVMQDKGNREIAHWADFKSLDQFAESPQKMIFSARGLFKIKSDNLGGFHGEYSRGNILYDGLAISLPETIEDRLIEIGGPVKIQIRISGSDELLVAMNSRAGFIISENALTKGSPFGGSVVESDGELHLYRVN